jgi:hypothetical protein
MQATADTVISLTFSDLSTSTFKTNIGNRRPPEVLCFRGKFFKLDREIGNTFYKEIDGEYLNNIQIP